MKYFLIIIFSFLVWNINLLAQGPKVPSKMRFADMELSLSPAAQKKIQASVDALVRSPKHFQIKVDRAHLYFPYIEQAFKEENLPTDFKYLVLQESGLVSDAVSSSNAIGFWQFKVPAATEVGITIDNRMDERMHIIRSSHGAAKYLKQNNMFFGNWIYALQAYNTGAGGAKKTADSKWFGKKRMDIESTTHWYVLKFLAHKIAFDDAFRKIDTQPLKLLEYKTKGESLKKISQKFDLPLEEIERYNKWLKVSSVPTDREYYSVMLPVPKDIAPQLASKIGSKTESDSKEGKATSKYPDQQEVDSSPNISRDIVETLKEFPSWFTKRKREETSPESPHIVSKFNGLLVIKAQEGDTKDILALNGGISTSKFLRYNDMKSFHKIKPDNYYYLERKKSSHFAKKHIVKPGETLWGIAQHYGIRLKPLLRKNRMKKYEPLKYGRVLWLKSKRPRKEPVEYVEIELEEPKKENKKEVTRTIKKAEDVLENLPDEHASIDTSKIKKEVKEEFEEGLKEIKENPLPDSNNTSGTGANPEEQKESGTPYQIPEEVVVLERDAVYHTVMQGETMYSISKKYGVTSEDILQWNDMPNTDLKIDQQLVVGWEEKTNEPPKEFIYHTVKQGETMYSISKEYEVSIPEILEWNDKSSEALNIDERIKILKK